MAKTRNKPTNYDKDVHIRVHQDYVEKIKAEAEEKNITMAYMVRLIIEEHYANKD